MNTASQQTPTKVVFRKFPKGGIIALMPEVPVDAHFDHCESYESIGQHGAASADLSRFTKPATPFEYNALLRELWRIGYTVKVCTRVTRTMHHKRVQTLREWRTRA